MVSSKKNKVLLCWPYHRRHWVSIFNSLKDEIDFIFLNWTGPEMEIGSFIDSSKTYWFNYKNIQHLIKEINPDKVVFMGIDGPLAILLNHSCKKRKIPTYMIQHGIFHSYSAYIEDEALALERIKIKPIGDDKHKELPVQREIGKKVAAMFFLKSLSVHTIYPFITVFQIELLKRIFKSNTKAYYYTKHSSRRANQYIVFTKFSSSILKIRDGVPDKAMIEIGNQEADDVFRQIENEESPIYCDKAYYLLIDDPLGEIADYNTNGIFPKEDINSFHQKLNQYALLHNKKLLIKLHPDSYNSTFFKEHENVIFIKQANLANLIKFSSGVFGGTSTLLIPALKLKPCCLFKYNDKFDLHQFLTGLKYAAVLNYKNFKAEEIIFNEHITDEQRAKFTEAYLFRNDESSDKRIREILLS